MIFVVWEKTIKLILSKNHKINSVDCDKHVRAIKTIYLLIFPIILWENNFNVNRQG